MLELWPIITNEEGELIETTVRDITMFHGLNADRQIILNKAIDITGYSLGTVLRMPYGMLLNIVTGDITAGSMRRLFESARKQECQ